MLTPRTKGTVLFYHEDPQETLGGWHPNSADEMMTEKTESLGNYHHSRREGRGELGIWISWQLRPCFCPAGCGDEN